MRKTQLRRLAVLAVIWAGLGMIGADLTNAQPSSPPRGQSRASSSSSHADDLFDRLVAEPVYAIPPRPFIPGPPRARRVRSGWATDPRPLVRAPIKAIQCGQLLDVRQQRVRRNVTILINGERITEIRSGRVRPENADAVIDLHDQICAPGLMDMHLQLTSAELRTGEMERPLNYFDYSVTETAIGLENARETLYSGVTTSRSPGEYLPNQAIPYLRDAIDKWELPGPRIFLASNAIGSDAARALMQQGHTGVHRPGGNNVDYEPTRSGDDVRQAVRNALVLGEDWIKVNIEVGGDVTPGVRHAQVFTAEELQAMADEAHKWGARITGQAETDGAARQAILAGFDSIEAPHISSRETADLMKARNVYWSTSLTDLTPAYDPADPRIGADEMSQRSGDFAELLQRRDESFRYAYSIGLPIVYASGGHFEPGASRSRMVLEFSMYLALGVTPWDVLRFATLNPAVMLGEADNLGSLDPGKYADIIALPRNPLEDITAFNRVNFVMKGGNVVRDDMHRSPLPDAFVLQLPDAAYTVTDPHALFTIDNLTCTGRDC